MNILKFWAVFTVGVASGAIVALICAPQSGEKTRRQLKRKFEDAGDYLKDASDTLGEHAERVVKRGKDALGDVADSATKVANKAVKTVSEMV
jgi:gas vesicle protein